MRYHIDGNKLVITVDAEEQAELIACREDPEFTTDGMLHDKMENLVCNSDLMWINPENTGDLTDAPMLGILGEESTKETGPHGVILAVQWDGKDYYQPIEQRWAYMDYAVRSPLEDLADTGEVVFVSE